MLCHVFTHALGFFLLSVHCHGRRISPYRDSGFVQRTLARGDTEALEILGGVWSSLQDMEAGGQRPKSWEDCVRWARCKWQTVYSNDIRQLLHCFPPEEVKSHEGKNNSFPCS